MKRTLRAVVPAIAALLVAAAGSAQTVPSSYRYIQHAKSLNFYGGWLQTDPELALPDSQSAELGVRSAPIFGVRAAIRVGGPLSVEGGLAFAPTERKLYDVDVLSDSSRVPDDTGVTSSELLMLAEFGLRFHVTGERTFRGFAPFVLASGGVAAMVGGSNATEDSIASARRFDFGPALAVGTGAGVDYFASDRVSLRAELTYRLWRLTAPEGMVPAGTRDRTSWKGNGGVSVGVGYHF